MKLIENRNKFMENARDEVAKNLLCWSKDLERRAEGVHMVNPGKACQELLCEIIRKVFNSEGNEVLKRYYCMFLARGGKEVSSRSSLRDCERAESKKVWERGKQSNKTKLTPHQDDCKLS